MTISAIAKVAVSIVAVAIIIAKLMADLTVTFISDSEKCIARPSISLFHSVYTLRTRTKMLSWRKNHLKSCITTFLAHVLSNHNFNVFQKVSTRDTKLRMQQKQVKAMYSAAVNQLEFGSAIAPLVASRAMALPNPSWLTVAMDVAMRCFCCLQGFVAHVDTLLWSTNWTSLNYREFTRLYI